MWIRNNIFFKDMKYFRISSKESRERQKKRFIEIFGMRQHYLKSLYFTHLTNSSKKTDFSHDLLC